MQMEEMNLFSLFSPHHYLTSDAADVPQVPVKPPLLTKENQPADNFN